MVNRCMNLKPLKCLAMRRCVCMLKLRVVGLLMRLIFSFFQRDRFICRVYTNILLQDAIKFLIVVMERIKEEPCKMIKRDNLGFSKSGLIHENKFSCILGNSEKNLTY